MADKAKQPEAKKEDLKKEVLSEEGVLLPVKPKAPVKEDNRAKHEKRWKIEDIEIIQNECPPSILHVPNSFKEYAQERNMFLCWINKKNYASAKDRGYVNAEDFNGSPCPELHDTILMMMPMKKHDTAYKQVIKQDMIQTGKIEQIKQRQAGNLGFNPHAKNYTVDLLK